MKRMFGTSLALAALVASTGISAGDDNRAAPPAPDVRGGAAAKGELRIAISELRSNKGQIIACLTAQPEKFPKCRGDSKAKQISVSAVTSTLVFTDVAPGRYAVALLHDENGNGKADRAISMIPREGFGFSRDAKVRMGPPKFDAAAFDMRPGRNEMLIRMRYML